MRLKPTAGMQAPGDLTGNDGAHAVQPVGVEADIGGGGGLQWEAHFWVLQRFLSEMLTTLAGNAIPGCGDGTAR